METTKKVLEVAKKRGPFLVIGLVAEYVLANAFDYGLCPYMVWEFGLMGALLVSLFSLVICLSVLLFYNWSKKDWFGIEAIKGLREYQGARRVLRAASWILRRGQVVSFLFLSIKFDPFTTVAYMRSGADEFPPMSARDWKIFLASWLIGNASWLAVVSAGVSLAKSLLRFS